MAIKPIGLSFKDNPEDQELYDWIISHSGKSAFIKDTLRAAKESETPKKENKSSGAKITSLIDMDY
jgi:hypothetical protein